MKIEVTFTGDSITPQMVTNHAVVVIDVLRATSTMVTALANGAQEIIPCLTPEEAFQILGCAGEKPCLLGGERKAKIIPGFHLGNSPFDYPPEKVAGKIIIMTTTNGTKAFLNAAGAKLLLVGSLLNSGAVARELTQQTDDVILACAGTGGKFSYDDILAAGCIVHKVSRGNPEILISDSALMTRHIYEKHQHHLAEGLFQTYHGKRLLALGLKEDIEFCTREDFYPIVPVWQKGVIKIMDTTKGLMIY
ncbi:2-phosphosulfolactate phosphatase [Candidatus Formimonas warabiya]|uniref:Probable 2-phosphosulfolactate phosphatase n=1 Tax=Formimonas warabiya TaxID=1761012 RepID=A0A3G1KY06_FORW1|nr:2-phosphosulfolactate phosphatase [Candidatus Formimonas warabiya]ATW27277.1 hypothetical protein DCMF_23230 [Candidatus Formimonas warabiya]